MTLLIGCEGSMGKRYQAILNHLNEPFEGCDVHKYVKRDLRDFDRYIIASPTNTHFTWYKTLEDYGKPILCEKPLSKNLEEALEMINGRAQLTLMMQYRFLLDPSSIGPSWFDYFRHGNDGLVWDCFQIIALSSSRPTLAESSPIWNCGINGKRLSLGDMDGAYVSAVRAFLSNKLFEPHLMQKWHEKVRDFEVEWTQQKYQS